MKRIFIAIPIYSDCDFEFLRAICAVLADNSLNAEIAFQNGVSLISLARNVLAARFLASACDELLFIDADVIVTAEQIHRLCAHPVPIVGGFYQIKQEGPIRMAHDPVLPPPPISTHGLQEQRAMGTGFLRIHRCVFEKMIEVIGGQIWYHPDGSFPDCIHHDFFPSGVCSYPDGRRRYLSEDWFFCQRARDLGFKVFGDTRIVAPHRGKINFPLQSQLNPTLQTV